jgi:DNA-directed RNA polymerase
MTTVYGVTFVGAREQIAKQLKDRRDIPTEECWEASSYLAKKVRVMVRTSSSGSLMMYLRFSRV